MRIGEPCIMGVDEKPRERYSAPTVLNVEVVSHQILEDQHGVEGMLFGDHKAFMRLGRLDLM